MLAGVRDILLVCNPADLDNYKRLLGSGANYGINLFYITQLEPRGIAEAFILGADFIGNDCVWLVLGDNLFYGQGLSTTLRRVNSGTMRGATVFAYPVNDPSDFAVIVLDSNYQPKSIAEKPNSFQSKYAVTGLYFYDNQVVGIARSIKPSARGELEITSINQVYLERGELRVEMLGRGMTWLDAGTPERMIEASEFVRTLEKRQGYRIACLEEIAWRNGWLTTARMAEIVNVLPTSAYKNYLVELIEGNQ
jgi:glucose-1-phosphate thymidylyltransferase